MGRFAVSPPATSGALGPPARPDGNESFPAFLHRRLQFMTKKYPKAVEWVGKTGLLFHPEQKTFARAMWEGLGYSSLDSLRRQLNVYGWRKVQSGKLEGCFHRPNFSLNTDYNDLLDMRTRGPVDDDDDSTSDDGGDDEAPRRPSSAATKKGPAITKKKASKPDNVKSSGSKNKRADPLDERAARLAKRRSIMGFGDDEDVMLAIAAGERDGQDVARGRSSCSSARGLRKDGGGSVGTATTADAADSVSRRTSRSWSRPARNAAMVAMRNMGVGGGATAAAADAVRPDTVGSSLVESVAAPMSGSNRDDDDSSVEVVETARDRFDALLRRGIDKGSQKRCYRTIYWTDCGRGFVLDRRHPSFDKDLLKIFGYARFASFLRIVNQYGFHKQKEGPLAGAYMREDFVREDSDDEDSEEDAKTSARHAKDQNTAKHDMTKRQAGATTVVPPGPKTARNTRSRVDVPDPIISQPVARTPDKVESSVSSLPTRQSSTSAQAAVKAKKEPIRKLPARGSQAGPKRMTRASAPVDKSEPLSDSDDDNELIIGQPVPVEVAAKSGRSTRGQNDAPKNEQNHAYQEEGEGETLGHDATEDGDDGTGMNAEWDSDDDDEDDEPMTVETEEENVTPKPPDAKFAAGQRVYARDKDGVMYEAVIRRCLYGDDNQRQAFLGLTNVEEADVLLESENAPCWHYFVHYQKWNVNWDRWVHELDVYEPSEKIVAYAKRLMDEHRALQKQLQKPTKNKKAWQTVDGVEFLTKWRQRMFQIDQELGVESRIGQALGKGKNSGDERDEALAKSAKTGVRSTSEVWTKATLATEAKLREKSLSGKRNNAIASRVALPFTLKKVLVEQWEIIAQCRMLPALPARVTIRQALDMYLESKGIAVGGELSHNPANGLPGATADSLEPLKANDGSVEDDAENASPVASEGTASAGDNDANGPEADNAREAVAEQCKRQRQEWVDMANGLAMLFDEALPERILYQEELPQLRVIDSLPEFVQTPYSELYGCEHLLRLFLRLPELLADAMDEAEARPLLAKVNDFVRFLNKNDHTLLTVACRNLNDAELREQQKIFRIQERKRQQKAATMPSNHASPAKKARIGV